MPSLLNVSLRPLWRALFPFAVPFLSVATLAVGIMLGGAAWLLMVPVMFALGRAYGNPSEPHAPGHHAEYGVGAALAGFTPAVRK